MKAIIIEGRENGSEYKFWLSLIKYGLPELYKQPNHGLYCAGSSSRITEQLNNLLGICLVDYQQTYIKSNILICLDTTADKKFSSIDMDSVTGWVSSNRKKVAKCMDIHFAEYYCFEDCLLLFEYFLKWQFTDLQLADFKQSKQCVAYSDYLKVPSGRKQELAGKVLSEKEHIHLVKFLEEYQEQRKRSREEAESDKTEEVKPKRKAYSYKKMSFESIAGALLPRLTRRNQHIDFRVNKGDCGKCWLCDCNLLVDCNFESFETFSDKSKCRLKEIELKTYSQKRTEAKSAMLEQLHKDMCGLYGEPSLFDAMKNLSAEDKAKAFLYHSEMLYHIVQDNPWLIEA